MKKKLKKLIHKYISIPKYEKKLKLKEKEIEELRRDKDEEIAELKEHKKYLQAEMYRYKNKYREKLIEIRKNKLNGR